MTTATAQRPPLILEEGELAILIRHSRQDRVVETTWGTGELPDTPGNQWARDFILDRRWDLEIPKTAIAMMIQEEGEQ